LRDSTAFSRFAQKIVCDCTMHANGLEKPKRELLKDAETAASCLIEAAPKSSSYIQIDGGEVPTNFVDLTGRCARRTERRLADKPWPPRN
jgi:hypothetical protein